MSSLSDGLHCVNIVTAVLKRKLATYYRLYFVSAEKKQKSLVYNVNRAVLSECSLTTLVRAKGKTQQVLCRVTMFYKGR